MQNNNGDVKLSFPENVYTKKLNNRAVSNFELGNIRQFLGHDDLKSDPGHKRSGSPSSALSRSIGFPITNLIKVLLIFALCLFVLVSLFHGPAIALILIICLLSLALSRGLVGWLLKQDNGSTHMRQISDAIREGSDSFFSRVYGSIFRLSFPLAIFLFFVYFFRGKPNELNRNAPSATVSGMVASISFLIGAFCSAVAGYVGLWVSVRANVRVAASATASYYRPIQIALRAGGIVALIVVTMVVLGISILFLLFNTIFGGNGEGSSIPFSRIPLLLVGFGFGASFVAMFSQLGGGIFTKAADVGADLVGKIEQEIPEDDPRNPAVIADLVGDNVGDCSARGADLFESISAEIISTMILAGTLSRQCNMSDAETRGFILFPLIVHAFDLVVSTAGILSVGASVKNGKGSSKRKDPLEILKNGYKISLFGAVIYFFVATRLMLYTDSAPRAWFNFFLCGIVGMISAYLQLLMTQYFTDAKHRPVQTIADASTSGHATNVIAGIAVGMESVFIPVVIMCISIVSSFYLGKYSGLKNSDGALIGGLFGTAIATMGMLSTAVYILAMDVFGPIADNAGGIVEMSGQPESVREVTDALDSVGNTTKATTKGYAVGSAALASFLLLRAFLDEVSDHTGKKFDVVDIGQPEVFVGGFLGAAMVFLFASMAMSAVGASSQAVVEEVRRQFRTMPGIMDGSERPRYGTCVDVVSRAALRKMIAPGMLATIMPIAVGLLFRFLGSCIGDDTLGPKALSSFIMFSTVSGICVGLFLNNSGGAWDNTKKLIETGAYGGKGSDAHKAAVTGDTVGDPSKDCAGPAMHVLIKLVATICMVLAPLFVS